MQSAPDAPLAEPSSSVATAAARGLRALQVRAFGLTWLAYASYYLLRKNFSVVKTSLETDVGISVDMLGNIETLYLALYAAGQFLNGALGDRLGARRMIAFGMIAASMTGMACGFGESSTVFLIAFGLSGLLQSTGWPNGIKAMTPWFTRKQRGTVMGIWCTNYQVGGLVATALATFLLAHFGWRAAFTVPSVWVAAVGALILFFLVEKPQDRGLPPVEDLSVSDPVPEGGSAQPADPRTAMSRMLRVPALWALGCAYFGLKLIRYSLLFWLPYYLEKELGYGKEAAGYMSTSFEAGGVLGTILVGYFSDRFFATNRSRLIAPMLFGLAGALLLYQLVGASGMVPNALAMALCGFLLFGPDTLISGAAAQDIGGTSAAASAAGIVNGIGSVGAVLQGVVTAQISIHYGWNALFYLFIALALLSAVAILPLALRGGTGRQKAQ